MLGFTALTDLFASFQLYHFFSLSEINLVKDEYLSINS